MAAASAAGGTIAPCHAALVLFALASVAVELLLAAGLTEYTLGV